MSVRYLQLRQPLAAALRLLVDGALAPLHSFMGVEDAQAVLRSSALRNGTPFPTPVLLPVEQSALDGQGVSSGTTLLLRDLQNRVLASLEVQEAFAIPPELRACALVPPLPSEDFAVAGTLAPTEAALRSMLPEYGRTPAQVAARRGDGNLLAVEWLGAEPDAAVAALERLRADYDGSLLLNLCEPETRIDDFGRFRRLRALRHAVEASGPGQKILLNTVDLRPARGDERELLLHALLHRNYGAARLLLLQPLPGTNGNALSEQAWQQVCARAAREYSIYLERREPGWASISAAQGSGGEPQEPGGCCVWLTGFSGAGKSSIAEALALALMERGRRVTVLDGDVVRTHLSRGLSFSRQDRNDNVCRIGFVAAEIVRHGGIAICALVSPYRESRDAVRALMPPGTFIEVFVDAPLAICEARDAKGLYAQARSGELGSFTGLSDPYEPPEHPEIHLRAAECSVTAETETILRTLQSAGLLPKEAMRSAHTHEKS